MLSAFVIPPGIAYRCEAHGPFIVQSGMKLQCPTCYYISYYQNIATPEQIRNYHQDIVEGFLKTGLYYGDIEVKKANENTISTSSYYQQNIQSYSPQSGAGSNSPETTFGNMPPLEKEYEYFKSSHDQQKDKELYFGNLPINTEASDIYNLFDIYKLPRPKNIEMKRSVETKKFFAFALFGPQADINDIIDVLDDKIIAGSKIKVQHVKERRTTNFLQKVRSKN